MKIGHIFDGGRKAHIVDDDGGMCGIIWVDKYKHPIDPMKSLPCISPNDKGREIHQGDGFIFCWCFADDLSSADTKTRKRRRMGIQPMPSHHALVAS